MYDNIDYEKEKIPCTPCNIDHYPSLLPTTDYIMIYDEQKIQPHLLALSEEEKKSCEGLVNEEECMNALKDFNNNKTPGTDGLPAEFYRFFWPDICHDLLANYNFASQHGMLSISQR